jgi:hypothetical protein
MVGHTRNMEIFEDLNSGYSRIKAGYTKCSRLLPISNPVLDQDAMNSNSESMNPACTPSAGVFPAFFFGRSESMESQMMSGVADNVFVVEAISPVEALSIPMPR